MKINTNPVETEEKIEAAPVKKVVATASVFCRVDHSLDAKSNGILNPGDIAEVIDETEDWYDLLNRGWSMKKFFEIKED